MNDQTRRFKNGDKVFIAIDDLQGPIESLRDAIVRFNELSGYHSRSCLPRRIIFDQLFNFDLFAGLFFKARDNLDSIGELFFSGKTS